MSCCFPSLFRLSPVCQAQSAVDSGSEAYSTTMAAPHEFFDHTGYRGADGFQRKEEELGRLDARSGHAGRESKMGGSPSGFPSMLIGTFA
jgi:hypothetical protein